MSPEHSSPQEKADEAKAFRAPVTGYAAKAGQVERAGEVQPHKESFEEINGEVWQIANQIDQYLKSTPARPDEPTAIEHFRMGDSVDEYVHRLYGWYNKHGFPEARDVVAHVRDNLKDIKARIDALPVVPKPARAEETGSERSREYLKNIAANSAAIKELLRQIPPDELENFEADYPPVSELVDFRGDVDKYVQHKLDSYRKNLGAEEQEWGQYQVMDELERLRGYMAIKANELAAQHHSPRTENRTGRERVVYKAAPEAEQVARFKALRSFMSGNYHDLFDNMYKYTDQVSIPGKLSPEEVRAVFNDVQDANSLISDALDYYLEVQRQGAGVTSYVEDSYQNLDSAIEDSHGFANRENRQLNVDKLVEVFRWAATTARQIGDRFGRPVNIDEQAIENECADLRAILTQVNQYR